MNLYELSQNYLAVQDMDLEPETLKDTLDSITDAWEDKAENIVKLIRTVEAEEQAYAVEEKRFNGHKKTMANKKQWLKGYLADMMLLTGKTKCKVGVFNISLQNNPPSLDVLDESLLPKRFFIEQAPTIDKQAIKDLLKQGEEVPGAILKTSQSLRIR